VDKPDWMGAFGKMQIIMLMLLQIKLFHGQTPVNIKKGIASKIGNALILLSFKLSSKYHSCFFRLKYLSYVIKELRSQAWAIKLKP
jgi:hypothetical protein